jgi:hypothetical protein
MNDRHVVSVSPKLATSGGGSRTLAERLENADPAVDEGPLSDAEVQRMRRAIVYAGRERTSRGAIAWKTSWAALTLVVAGSAVFGIARWREPRADAPVVATHGPARVTSEPRRQVHFVAPGGTRVIWIFNPDFKP